MNTLRKAIAATGLAVVALGTFAALPASAQYYHHPNYHPMQRRHAVRLSRQAARAAYNGNYVRAARLHTRAAHLRHTANHGY